MRNGKPKVAAKEAPKKDVGAMAKGKDDGGKVMMTEKEAYTGIKEYMIKVSFAFSFYLAKQTLLCLKRHG